VRLAESPLAEVFASQRALLIGRLQLAYQLASPEMGKIPPMFDPDLLEQAVLARLPPGNLVDDLAMGRLMIGRQRLWLKLLIALAILAAVGSTLWLLLGWG
jgi:hypothetical protein